MYRNKLCAWRHNMPRPSPPPWAPKPSRAAEQTQRGSTFPRRIRSYADRGLVTLTFDLLILKVLSDSRVTWTISVPIFVFLDLSVLKLRPMYVTDVRRQIDVRQKHRLMPRLLLGAGHNKCNKQETIGCSSAEIAPCKT